MYVDLVRLADGAPLRVISSHLQSGEKDEAKRLAELHGPAGIRELFSSSVAEGATLLCLDANSAPDRTEEKTVSKEQSGGRQAAGR